MYADTIRAPIRTLWAGPVAVTQKEHSKYTWNLKLVFMLDVEENRWHLENYGLHAYGVNSSLSAADYTVFHTLRMPHNTSSSLDHAWPPVPVGSGFACSQLELPLEENSTIRLSNFRVVAFANNKQLPTAQLYTREGLRNEEEGLGGLDWVHCPADTTGLSWLVHLGWGLFLIAVLAMVGGLCWAKWRGKGPYRAARTTDN